MTENKVIEESKQGESLLIEKPLNPNGKKLFLESYGCAMNFSDSEIVASILKEAQTFYNESYRVVKA